MKTRYTLMGRKGIITKITWEMNEENAAIIILLERMKKDKQKQTRDNMPVGRERGR